MNKVKTQFVRGIKEGWTLFWSPLTGFYKAGKQVIVAEAHAPGVANSFKAGLREGWTLSWSPLSAFIKAAKSIVTSK